METYQIILVDALTLRRQCEVLKKVADRKMLNNEDRLQIKLVRAFMIEMYTNLLGDVKRLEIYHK